MQKLNSMRFDYVIPLVREIIPSGWHTVQVHVYSQFLSSTYNLYYVICIYRLSKWVQHFAGQALQKWENSDKRERQAIKEDKEIAVHIPER
jgi:hypothetical protein